MELFELQNSLVRKTLPKFLIFVGNDYALSNVYIDKIAEFLKLQRTDLDTLESAFTTSKVISLVSEGRLYVNKYDKTVASKENVWTNIENKLKNNYLIVVLTEIDKRSKLYNTFTNNIVNFNPQPDNVLIPMLKKKTALSDENLAILSKACENNYGKCLIELSKLHSYVEYSKKEIDPAFKILTNAGVIKLENTEVLFQFIDSVAARKKNTYQLYTLLKERNESNILILSLLYTAFKNQLIVQTVKEITPQSTGLTQYAINSCAYRKGIYTNSELKRAIKILKELEQGLKNGTYEEPIVIDYFIAQVLV